MFFDGQSKSEVLRLCKRKSAELVEQMQQADLSKFGLVVLMLDAVVLSAGLVHKERNLQGYLSKRHWGELAGLFARLRKCQGKTQAEEIAEEIESFLSDKNAQAKASWAEVGEELLALPRLDVTNELHRSLLSTNCIENIFKNLRQHIGKVCRWRESTDQADRWMASGLILASKGFNRIVGHKHLP